MPKFIEKRDGFERVLSQEDLDIRTEAIRMTEQDIQMIELGRMVTELELRGLEEAV